MEHGATTVHMTHDNRHTNEKQNTIKTQYIYITYGTITKNTPHVKQFSVSFYIH